MGGLNGNDQNWLDDLNYAIQDMMLDYKKDTGFAIILVDSEGNTQISSNIKKAQMVRYLREMADNLEKNDA